MAWAGGIQFMDLVCSFLVVSPMPANRRLLRRAEASAGRSRAMISKSKELLQYTPPPPKSFVKVSPRGASSSSSASDPSYQVNFSFSHRGEVREQKLTSQSHHDCAPSLAPLRVKPVRVAAGRKCLTETAVCVEQQSRIHASPRGNGLMAADAKPVAEDADLRTTLQRR